MLAPRMCRVSRRRDARSTEARQGPTQSLALRRFSIAFFLTLIALLGCGSGPPADDSQALCAPLMSCGGNCVDTASDRANCGACGTSCDAGDECISGRCKASCRQDELRCEGECRSPASDPEHCGSCGAACEPGQYCDAGQCQALCSGDLCPGAGDSLVCAHLSSDPNHCGTCGQSCPPSQVCEEGACVVACAADEERCDGACTATLNDPLHCGACGKACLVSEVCRGGACTCPAGTDACGVGCFDLQTSSEHCGACNQPCGEGASCVHGECKCDGAALTDCGGTCVNLLEDTSHCGSCGASCESFESCEEGRCFFEDDGCGGAPRNIDLSRVALYQAVEVDLFKDGEAISPAERNAQVIQGRDAVLRGFVSLRSGSTERTISMRVVVRNEGQESVLFHRRTVSKSSVQDDLSSTFLVDVPAKLMGANATYSVSLVSCDPSDSDGTLGDVRFPRGEDFAELSALKTGRVKVAFVPLIHDGRTPDTSDEALAKFVAKVMAEYPIEGVDFRVVSAIASGFSGVDFDWGRVLDETIFPKRIADQPSPDEYYYGLIQPTQRVAQYCNEGCTAGIGYVTTGVSADNVPYRAAMGLGFGEDVSWSAMPHELGHNHGRDHAPCGVVADDKNYPYANAFIGSYGYDLANDALLSPQIYHDLMSYCSPVWISDYNFSAIAERVTKVNSSAMASSFRVGPPRSWWSILSTPSGRRWSHPRTTEGPLDHPLQGVVYDENLNPVAEVELGQILLSEGGGYVLLVPPPEAGWYAVGIANEAPLAY
jgi:hypothetical protein